MDYPGLCSVARKPLHDGLRYPKPVSGRPDENL